MEFIKNAAGRKIPLYVEGVGELKPYRGAFETELTGRKYAPRKSYSTPFDDKMLNNIREAIEKVGLRNGMTISFHHHLRDGDYILIKVVDEIAYSRISTISYKHFSNIS